MPTINPAAELKERIAEIKERFAVESVDAKLTVRRDDGLYRHLEIEMPKSSAYWCEVMTWPGALAITGHTGSHIFRRDDDMLGFFRQCMATGTTWEVDTRYWAEKVQPDGVKDVQAYAEDRVRAYIKQAAEEAEDDNPGLVDEVEKELLSRYSSAELETEAGAKTALAGFDYEGFRFDTSEWEFTEYDYWFLYTCQVIAWAVAQYDARVPAAA